jgi:hypothetical protein
MSFCGRTMVVLKQSRRRFPERVDFNTCEEIIKENRYGRKG